MRKAEQKAKEFHREIKKSTRALHLLHLLLCKWIGIKRDLRVCVPTWLIQLRKRSDSVKGDAKKWVWGGEEEKKREKKLCSIGTTTKKKKTAAWWILWMARTEYPTLVTRSNSPKSAFFDFRLQPPLPFLARENRTKMGEKTQLSRAFGFEVCSKLASSVPQRCRNSYTTLRKRRFTTVCFDLLLFTHFCLFTSAKPLKLWSWQNNNNNKKKKGVQCGDAAMRSVNTQQPAQQNGLVYIV